MHYPEVSRPSRDTPSLHGSIIWDEPGYASVNKRRPPAEEMLVPQRVTPDLQPTPEDARVFTVRDTDGGILHRVHAATSSDIDRAIQTCYDTRRAWRETPIEDRCRIVLRAAGLIEDESTGWKRRLLEANRAEIPISDFWSSAQLDEIVVDGMRVLASQVEAALVPSIVEEPRSTIEITREPFGVCLAFAPWNTIHPLVMRAICNPLLAGNTVILKTHEASPYTQYLWVELLYEAGLMPGALCVVHVDTADAPALVKQLVEDRRVRNVNLCGSGRIGSIVAGLAGAALKPVMMELGGKGPALLLPDADLETAASHLMLGAFNNSGQICMSTERILIAESQVGRVVELLQSAWREAPQGKTKPLYSKNAASRFNALINDAKAKGAENILRKFTELSSEDARAVAPSILVPLSPDMTLWTEESFGPTVGIIPIPDKQISEADLVDKMVEIANASDYGLTASVWSRDLAKAKRVAGLLECGAVHINLPTAGDPALVPHGGWKGSGWGRFNGIEGLRTFTQTRSIETPRSTTNKLPLAIFGL